ncbi:hypothetical protein Tco_1418783 [Tanacetum coccineum]
MSKSKPSIAIVLLLKSSWPLIRLLLWEIGRLPTWQGFSFGGKVAFDLLRDALSAIFGLSELKEPMTDQPLSAYASPTALSPGYIADSDPEEDKEDPEEDPADHPADG